MEDKIFMRRCFQLARLGSSTVRSNPMVGAVIVHQGRVIGEGWHKAFGEAHAEVMAIHSVTKNDRPLLSHSTLYVSLEPCSHHGKTPPCADLILRHHIPRVKIACLDVNPLVAGRGVQRLRENGVSVTTGMLEKEGQQLIRRFRIFHTQKRPYIILKWAQSADGYIGQKGQQIWLTGNLSKRLVHQWRTEEMAIMVGTKTALVDNPQLTSRLYPGPQPLRLILDAHHKIPKGHHLLSDENKSLYISQKERKDITTPQWIHDFGAALLPQLMEHLHQLGIKSMIVEGGAQLLHSFIHLGLWDEARILLAKEQFLGHGIAAPRLSQASHVYSQKIGKDELHLFRKNILHHTRL